MEEGYGEKYGCNLLSMSKKSQNWRRAALSHIYHNSHVQGRSGWVAKERGGRRARASGCFEDWGLERGRMSVQ